MFQTFQSFAALAIAFFILAAPLSAVAFQEDGKDPLGTARRADQVINVWQGEAPSDNRKVGSEQDFTKKSDKLIAGKRIIKLGNVAVPQLHVFYPPSDKRNGTSVVVCPGGGFHILAWDLEGTEVATWLNSLGITAIVLKYRVPTNRQQDPWLNPVQDAQRAISFTRHNAANWKIDKNRVGILGFSAGGRTAAITSYGGKRFYRPINGIDTASCQPDFSILIYAARLANDVGDELQDNLKVHSKSPPTYMVHAFDDMVDVKNPLALMMALKKAKVPSELHIFDRGGHGYGLRPNDKFPVTNWTKGCEQWLRIRSLLNKPEPTSRQR